MSFQPVTDKPAKVPTKVLQIDARLADVLSEKAKGMNMTRRDLVEQALRHCLQHLVEPTSNNS
jgi:hypothetical protein